MKRAARPRRVDNHWAEFLGVEPGALREPGLRVVAHAGLASYQGIWLFTRPQALLVSCPSAWLARAPRGADAAQQLARVLALGDADVTARIGPSYQGWLEAARFRPARGHAQVALCRGDAAGEIARLRAACAADEWSQSGIDPERAATWAARAGRRVVALGQLRARGDALDPCVIVHPNHRGAGHGLRVVSAICAFALRKRKLVLYQTLLANTPALAIARRLGFARYATLVALRLSPAALATPGS